jgi:hypothetical protein
MLDPLVSALDNRMTGSPTHRALYSMEHPCCQTDLTANNNTTRV